MAWNSRRLILWTSGLILAPVLLALIAFAVLVWGIDPDAFRGRVESAASQALGRSVRLTGGLHWRPGLKKRVHIDGVEIEGLRLHLQRAADGAVNWRFQPSAGQDAAAAGDVRLRVGTLSLRDGSVRYQDEAASRDFSLTGLRLDARLPEDFTADALRFADLRLDGRLTGAPVAPPGGRFEVRVPEFRLQKAAAQFSMPEWTLRWNDTEMEGAVQGQGGSASGRIRLQSPSLRQLLASVSFAAPPTRDAAALESLRLAAQFNVSGRSAALEQLDVTLDDTQVQGRVQLPGLSPLSLRFDLTADKVDVDRYLQPENVKSQPFELPLADLKALDAKGVLRIGRATMAGALAREMIIDVD